MEPLCRTGAVPNLMQAVLWIWPVMYKSIYGRFLLLQLGTAGNVVVLNVLISVFNISSRLATRQVRWPHMWSMCRANLRHQGRPMPAGQWSAAASHVRHQNC